jgi:predicted O-linked N-acetylglucosamine transferase (SPINDLY family)
MSATASFGGASNSGQAEAERALAEAFRSHQSGSLDDAIRHYRRAIAIHRDFPEALNNLGIALKEQRRFREAIVEYRKALHLRPDLPEISNNLGDAWHSMGDHAAAIEHYRRAVRLRPEYGVAWRNLSEALSEIGQHDEAAECLAKALTYAPGLDAALTPADICVREARRLFGNVVHEIESASARDSYFAAAYQACNESRPGDAQSQGGEQGRLAVQLHESLAARLSGLLLALHYDPSVTPDALARAHGEVQRCYGGRFDNKFPNSLDPERRMRIGYVSGDFRTHSVGYFLSSVFREHDDTAVNLYCYTNGSEEDSQTVFYKSRAAGWRPIVGLCDDGFAALVREDKIDILVDLSGHTKGNRLAAFARRLAPIQVTWLGYPDTTGLTTIDYRLTDAIADPAGAADKLSRERLIRLPDGFLCYSAPQEAPDIGPLPAAQQGLVTFGSFNNLAKMNASVIDLWATILKRVSGSRLLLKNRWLMLPDMRARVRRLFEERGIAPERIELMGKLSSTAEHLAAYGGMDVALDPFPYNGATTTCEALWMGVPVVTLAGDRHAARVGASLLRRVGLNDLVAENPQAYVETACRLAADTAMLTKLREELRGRVRGSPLYDAARFTRQLETAYRFMWRAWCDPSSTVRAGRRGVSH